MKRILIAGLLAILLSPLKGQTVAEIIRWIQEGRMTEARNALNSLEASSRQKDSILFLKGLIACDAEEAAGYYQKLIKTFPGSGYADKAMLRLGQLKYAQGLYKTSLMLFSKMDSDPKSALMQESLYWTGLCHLAMGQNDSAALVFGRVVSEFPARETSRLAAEELRNLNPRASSGEPAVETAPAAAEIKPAPAASPDLPAGRYSVQVGAFSHRDYALERKEFFENKGYQVQLETKTVNSKRLYLVWVGAFSEESKARAFAADLQQKYGAGTTLVTIP